MTNVLKGLTLGLILGSAAIFDAAPPRASAAPVTPTVSPSSTPALSLDAPDPDIVYSRGTYYAFTTGTTWGNYIGIAATTNGDPRLGWRTFGGAFPPNGA